MAWIFVFFSNPELARQTEYCQEQLWKSGENAGARARARAARRVPGERQPRPHLRKGGTLRLWTNQHLPALTWPPPASSRELGFSKQRGELGEHYPAVAAASSPFFLAMGLPNGTLASLLLRLFLLLQVPHGLAFPGPGSTQEGGRGPQAAVASRRARGWAP